MSARKLLAGLVTPFVLVIGLMIWLAAVVSVAYEAALEICERA